MKTFSKIRGWDTAGQFVEVLAHHMGYTSGAKVYELLYPAPHARYVTLSHDGLILCHAKCPISF